jgi:hypothetical protein
VPLVAGLLIGMLAFVPFANMVGGRRAAPWFAHVVVYWMVAGGALLLALLALASAIGHGIESA